MERKLISIFAICVIVAATLTVIKAQVAFGYDPAIATYTWSPGDPNFNPAAVIRPGTIDTTNLIMGDFLGGTVPPPLPSPVLVAPWWGDSGTSVGWDDNWVDWIGLSNTNGDNLDGLWVAMAYPFVGWWDLGFKTRQVVVFLSQDHGPFLAEGVECRVFGSNTLWGGVSGLAVLTDVYLQGWRPHNPAEDANGNGWCSDDVTGVYELPGEYRYVVIEGWDLWPPPSENEATYNDPEVDAVAASPPQAGVGGIYIPVNKLELLAPYIGSVSTAMIAAVAAAIYVKRVKRRKEKQ